MTEDLSDAAHDLLGTGSDPDTLAANAAAQISQKIERLELAPGTTVTERELAVQLGFGKAPVREALLRLSGTGLVTPRTGSGYVIAPITIRQSRSLFELWRALEGAALALLDERPCVTKHTAYPFESTMLERLRESRPEIDEITLSIAFHSVVLASSGNAAIARAFPFTEIGRLLRFAATLGGDAVCPDHVHRELWQAIADGDRAVAQRQATAHLSELQDRILNRLMKADQVQEINLTRTTSTPPDS